MIEQYWIIDKYLHSKKDFSEKPIFITSFYYTWMWCGFIRVLFHDSEMCLQVPMDAYSCGRLF